MLVLVIAFALILLALLIRVARVPVRHRWRRRQGRVMCRQLRGPDQHQPPVLIYRRLRAMDPLAFEELLLEAFELRGHKVIRNRRYTGDGGIDGRVLIGRQMWLIQAKRYASAIRPEHVDAFAALCARRRLPGLLIHTGRTGGMTRSIVAEHRHVELVSGAKLLDLLTGNPLTLGGRPV